MKLMFAAMANLTRVEFLAQVEWHFGTATDRLDLLLTVRRLVKERKGRRSCLLLDRSGQVLRVHGSGTLNEAHALGQGIWHPTKQSHLPTLLTYSYPKTLQRISLRLLKYLFRVETSRPLLCALAHVVSALQEP